PSDGDVQASLTALPVQRAEVQRHITTGVGHRGAESEGEKDRVTLVALHVLEILDEDALRCVERLGNPLVPALTQQGLDQVALLHVEGDDADRWLLVLPLAREAVSLPDLLDDRMGLDRVGAQQLAGRALPRAVELAVHTHHGDAVAVGPGIRLDGDWARER